jgi:hypothetical protein
MPNWVTNYVDIHHDDPAKLAEFKAIYDKCASDEKNSDRLFSHYLPCPAELIADGGWYDWCVQNWGTKWDAVRCQPLGDCDPDNTLHLLFETAWSPPIAFFEFMKDRGFEIKAEYVDEAYNFIGCWNDGSDDCYGYDQLDNLPDYLSHLYTPFDEDAA